MQQLDNPHGNAQLIILEPNLATFSSLPILRGETKDSMAKMATPTRERRISIRDALESLLGPDAIGLVDESSKCQNNRWIWDQLTSVQLLVRMTTIPTRQRILSNSPRTRTRASPSDAVGVAGPSGRQLVRRRMPLVENREKG